MTEKIKSMIDMAASDGVITTEELRLIKRMCTKEDNVDEIDFYLLQLGCLVEDKCDFEISNDELVLRIRNWISRLEIGTYEGIVEEFPLKKSDANHKKMLRKSTDLFGKAAEIVKEEEKKLGWVTRMGAKAGKKALKTSTKFIPGGDVINSVGNHLVDGISQKPKSLDRLQIKFELDRYMAIAKVRVDLGTLESELYSDLLRLSEKV
ncbi:hypothetical protein [Flagellimonas marinaquae]|uniref:hypothetical protein n=1 Tax=Flagellimonas marinaquae TaxID=254955 RepID=UPI000F8E513F|nr:hypothetical protein [Allomuricauda aquimarina]